MSAASSPSNSVEVRSRVSGYLAEIRFTDGQMVKKDDLLFIIDHRPFQIALEQMRANLAQARANLAFAEADLARGQELVHNKTITEQTYDQRKQAKAVAEASVAAQEAMVHQAELDLNQYSELRAPIDGRIGDRRVSVGNLVTGGNGSNTTLLATIVSVDPIRFEFTFDEASYLRYQRFAGRNGQMAATTGPFRWRSSSSTSRISSTSARWISSTMLSTALRVRFAAAPCSPIPTACSRRACSAASALPGSPPYTALLIPDAAIGTEQSRKYVLVVDDGGVVRQKYVMLGQLDGGLRVIKDGSGPFRPRDRQGADARASRRESGGGRTRGTPTSAVRKARRSKSKADRTESGMRISHFFIDRPIFAAVISIIFVILGAVSFARLPIAQYPEIAPPLISVTGQYPGASAEVVASTVVTPIEQQINGVENMIYMASNSTADGRFSIAVSFELGTNLDIAQVQVQNRVAIATPRLPSDVRNIGVVVQKSSPDLMMVVHLYSPDKSRNALFISNYATLEVTDAVTRVDGVGSITVFGARDYSMRVWLDPDRLQSLGLTATDVTNALQGQNIQVASGILDQPPVAKPGAFQIAVQTLGRLADPEEFASIVVKQTPSAVVRLKDVAKVELAALDYSSNSYLDHSPAVALAIFQRPGSNALETVARASRD